VSDNEQVVYHLYGRTQYSQPLEFVRRITVAENEKPSAPQGETWLELIAFRESAIVQVLPREEEKTT
jgi:hypothetical protein